MNSGCNMQAKLATALPIPAAATSPGTKQGSLARRALPFLILVASRGGAILAQFAAQLAVGAMAGASGLGILQLFTSWTCMAGEALGLGLPTRALRQVAIDYADKRPELIHQSLATARRRILRAWWRLLAIAAIPLALFARSEAAAEGFGYSWLLIGVLLTAPLFALLRLYAESVKATGAALPAVTLENLLSPLALLAVCGICWLTGQEVAAITLLVTFGTGIFIASFVLRRILGQKLATLQAGAPPAVDSRPPLAPPGDLLYLWGTGILSIGFLHLPFLVMPLYVTTAEIGVYAIAHKLINVVTTVLLLLAAVYGPVFARSAARADTAGLLASLRRTQLISTAVFLPASVALVALAQPLAGMFGEDFGDLQLFLVILSGGQLVNACTGLSGVLLNMAGAARRELTTLVLALGIALACSLWVGPRYGAIGLALVFSGSIALKNLASYAMARHLLKNLENKQ